MRGRSLTGTHIEVSVHLVQRRVLDGIRILLVQLSAIGHVLGGSLKLLASEVLKKDKHTG